MNAEPTRKSPKSQPSLTLAQAYVAIRSRVLTLAPGEVGIFPTEEAPNVWGVLMEMAYPSAIYTLVALADGTTSLYSSLGGGILASGQHAGVAAAARALITEAENYVDILDVAQAYPLPGAGRVKFYVLTFRGNRTADFPEQELAKAEHDFNKFYARGQAVIDQIRKIEKERKS